MDNNFFFFFEKNLNFINYKNSSDKLVYKKHYKYTKPLYSLILSLLYKKGLKKKHLIVFFYVIQKIKLNILNKDDYTKEFIYNFNSMLKYNNMNFLLLWVLDNMNVTFQIVSKEVPKKYKKKNKNKYIFNLKYVFKNNRQKVKLYLIKKYYLNIHKSLKYNLFKLFFDLLFNYKNSTFYTNKIKLYNKLLK